MTNHSQTGTVQSLGHQTPTLTIESICSQSDVVTTTQLKHHPLNSTPRLTCHVSTNPMVSLRHTSSTCSKTGTQHIPWRKSLSVLRMKWSTIKSLLNQLTVTCSECVWSVSEQKGVNEGYISMSNVQGKTKLSVLIHTLFELWIFKILNEQNPNSLLDSSMLWFLNGADCLLSLSKHFTCRT